MSKLWIKYENWSKLGTEHQVYWYTPNMYRYMLAQNDQNLTCTGTCSRCTSTCHRKLPRLCVFVPFFHILLPNSTLYFIHTSKPFQIHLVTSIILNSSFNTYLNPKTYHDLLSNTILIWVITHTHTKYKNLLGFVLTQTLLLCN